MYLPPEDQDALLREAEQTGDYSKVNEAADPLPNVGAATPKVDDYIASGAQAIPDPDPEEATEDQPDPDAEREASEAPAPAAAPVATAPKQDYSPRVIGSTSGTEAKRVQTGPDWFNYLPPPKYDGLLPAGIQLGSGILQALIAPKDKKHRGVAPAMALGGALDAATTLATAPQQDYENQLKAAKTQAEMTATLRSGAGSNLGLANLDLQERKFKHLLDNEATKAQAAAALKDANSPESREIREAYVAAGIFKPEVASKMNGYQLMQSRVGAQQFAGSERQQGNWVKRQGIGYDEWAEKHAIERGDKMEDRALDRGEKLEDRSLNDQEKNEQAYIPGFTFVGKRAPNIASVEKARVVADNTAVATEAADNLIKIYDKMSTQAKLTPNWLEGTLSQEDLDLVNEARNWGLNLDTAQRNLANMGVPQQFEMEIVKSVNPDSNGIRAFLNNGAAWRAQKKVLEGIAARRMKSYGYAIEGSPESEAHYAPQPHKPLAAKLKEAGAATKGMVGDAIDAGKQVASGAIDTAKQVAGAAADVATGKKGDNSPNAVIGEFEITLPSGKKIRRRLTQQQYDQSESIGYPMVPVQ